MSKELKLYELRSTNRPAKSPILLTTVAVTNGAGEQFYCYVRFSERLVKDVGKKFSGGLHPNDPAYLHVVQNALNRWHVYAKKMGDNTFAEMWMTEDSAPPHWVKFHKLKVKNGNHQKGETSDPSAKGHTNSSGTTRRPGKPPKGSA